jgi:hypothetical protein
VISGFFPGTAPGAAQEQQQFSSSRYIVESSSAADNGETERKESPWNDGGGYKEGCIKRIKLVVGGGEITKNRGKTITPKKESLDLESEEDINKAEENETSFFLSLFSLLFLVCIRYMLFVCSKKRDRHTLHRTNGP